MSARRQGRIPPALFASFPLTSIPALAAILLGMVALAGCGQMGPLMLPGDESAEDDGTASAAGSASGSGSGGENEEGNGNGGENEQ